MEEELAQSRLGTPARAWAALPLSEAQPVWALLSTGDSVASLAVFAYSLWEIFLEVHSESWGESRGHGLRIHGWASGARNPLKLYTNIVCV